ncbi:MAG TPA: cytochrome c oxidase assembly protein [Candidatus Binatia bacterium]
MNRWRNLLFVAALVLLSVASTVFLWTGASQPAAWETVQVAIPYVTASYARDFREAYGFISSDDRRVTDKESYVRERGAFSGFALELSKKLAGFIKATPVEEKIDGNRAHVKLQLSFPDANKLSANLLGWDEERLNKLSPKERSELIETLDRRRKEGKIPMVEEVRDFELVREDRIWRIFLDWGTGVRVSFDTVVPGSLLLQAKPVLKEVTVTRGKLFNVFFKVKNLSNREVTTWIVHHVEPKEVNEYLELVECNLLLPVNLQPGREMEYPSSYLLRGDLAEGMKQFKVTYEFKVEER